MLGGPACKLSGAGSASTAGRRECADTSGRASDAAHQAARQQASQGRRPAASAQATVPMGHAPPSSATATAVAAGAATALPASSLLAVSGCGQACHCPPGQSPAKVAFAAPWLAATPAERPSELDPSITLRSKAVAAAAGQTFATPVGKVKPHSGTPARATATPFGELAARAGMVAASWPWAVPLGGSLASPVPARVMVGSQFNRVPLEGRKDKSLPPSLGGSLQGSVGLTARRPGMAPHPDEQLGSGMLSAGAVSGGSGAVHAGHRHMAAGGSGQTSRHPASSLSISAGQLSAPLAGQLGTPAAIRLSPSPPRSAAASQQPAQASPPPMALQLRSAASPPRRETSPPPRAAATQAAAAAGSHHGPPGPGACRARPCGPAAIAAPSSPASHRTPSQPPRRGLGGRPGERPREASPPPMGPRQRAPSPPAAAPQRRRRDEADMHLHTPIYVPPASGAKQRARSPPAAPPQAYRAECTTQSQLPGNQLVQATHRAARARSAGAANRQGQQRFHSISHGCSSGVPGRALGPRSPSLAPAAPAAMGPSSPLRAALAAPSATWSAGITPAPAFALSSPLSMATPPLPHSRSRHRPRESPAPAAPAQRLAVGSYPWPSGGPPGTGC